MLYTKRKIYKIIVRFMLNLDRWSFFFFSIVFYVRRRVTTVSLGCKVSRRLDDGPIPPWYRCPSNDPLVLSYWGPPRRRWRPVKSLLKYVKVGDSRPLLRYVSCDR